MRNAMIAVAGALLLSACQSTGSGRTGTAGATPDGSQAAVGAGLPPVAPMEGILLGAELGRSLDASDREMAVRAEYEALEYARAGTPAKWTNPTTGNSGSIVAGGVTEVNKLDCRDYTHTASIGGRTRVARGVACRQPGGTWRMTK